MMEKFSTVRVLIQIVEAERPNGPHCYYDQELDIGWKDDLSLRLEKKIGNGREPAYKGKKVGADPKEFITLLRGLADQIEFQVEMADEAQLEFEERAAVLEHDGNMSREHAEAQTAAETWE